MVWSCTKTLTSETAGTCWILSSSSLGEFRELFIGNTAVTVMRAPSHTCNTLMWPWTPWSRTSVQTVMWKNIIKYTHTGNMDGESAHTEGTHCESHHKLLQREQFCFVLLLCPLLSFLTWLRLLSLSSHSPGCSVWLWRWSPKTPTPAVSLEANPGGSTSRPSEPFVSFVPFALSLEFPVSWRGKTQTRGFGKTSRHMLCSCLQVYRWF